MKVKERFFFFLMIIFVGCNTTEQSQLNSHAYNGPRAWNKAAFPLNLKISTNFTSTEQSLIQDMGTAWEDSLSNRLDFFDLSDTTAEINTSNSDNLGDGTLGIYRSTSWSSDFSSSALAVTQIYLSNVIKGQISHADIVVNYSGTYTFRTGLSGSGYDLGTVILHELGHLIGLDHSPSSGFNRADSVMYPSINSSENKRVPQSYDINQLNTKYPASSGSNFSLLAHQETIVPEDHNTEAILVMELFPDGKCVHRIGDKIIHEHHHEALNH